MKIALKFLSIGFLFSFCNNKAESVSLTRQDIDTIVPKASDDRFCTFVDLDFEFVGTATKNGNRALIPLNVFNEYDQNSEIVPFPDTLILKSQVSNPSYTQGNFNIGEIYLKVYLQVKSSISYSCLMPINAAVSDTVLVLSKKISHIDFFHGKSDEESNYGDINFESRYLLKREIQKLFEQKHLSKKYMLNQIILTAYLSKESDFTTNCKIEYNYPVCIQENH